MGLQDEVKRITLVDYFLVEVDASVQERTTESGIVVVEDNQRVANFGTVIKTPDYYRENTNYRIVSKAKDTSSHTGQHDNGLVWGPSSQGELSWVANISEGDVVFFRRNVTHEPIELASGEPGKEYILVHTDNIVGFYKVNARE